MNRVRDRGGAARFYPKKNGEKKMKLGQSGVAVVAVVVIVAASMGVGVATPVIVSAKGVDPDSSLYGLSRLGESIRRVSDVDQMKLRWGEYQRMVAKGKGLEYKDILEEFVTKMHEVAPGDVAAKQEVVRWMQEQMPGMGMVQLRLCKEFCARLKEDLAGLPEVQDEIENEIDNIENYMQRWPGASLELQERIMAHLRLISERLENMAWRYRARIRGPIFAYLNIENMLVDVDVTVNVEVKIHGIGPPSLPVEFENKVEEFDNQLAEIQTMLEGAPENAPGRHAAERLVDLAIKFRDNAVTAYEENKVRRALALIYAAKIHLGNAERILDHASEWEPLFKEEWIQWRYRWENMKQEWKEEGIWENILQNREQFIERIRNEWQERKRG
jgi:hypothetical protein